MVMMNAHKYNDVNNEMLKIFDQKPRKLNIVFSWLEMND